MEKERAAEYRQRKRDAEKRGGQGCGCTGGNRRETEAFQGGTGWFTTTRLSKTTPATPIEMRENCCALRVSRRQCF